MKKLLSVLSFLLSFTFAFAQDSTAYQGKAGVADVADTDPGLFIVMMILLLGLIVAFVIGLIALFILAALAIVLTSLGILSFSVMVGLYRQSIRSGIRTLVLCGFTLLGAGAGIFGYIIFNLIQHVHFKIEYAFLFSAVGGMAGGLLGGLLALVILNLIYKRVVVKLKGKEMV